MVIVACFVAVILLAITVNLCISRLSLSPVERQFKNKMDVWASRKNVQVVLLRGILAIALTARYLGLSSAAYSDSVAFICEHGQLGHKDASEGSVC